MAFPASVSPLKLKLMAPSVTAGHTILHSISTKSHHFSQEAAAKNYGGSKTLFKRRSYFLPPTSHPSPEQKYNKNIEFWRRVTEVKLSPLFDPPLLKNNPKITKCPQQQ